MQLDARPAVIAIGASTGGTRALEKLLPLLPAGSPPVLIVQHMPGEFTAPFARRLDGLCAIDVREASDGDRLQLGTALVAPGNLHLTLEDDGAGLRVRTSLGEPEHHQRPAVDVLFRSVARCAGANAVGVVLTGMGADGARGLLAMREAGAHTIAEDASTCVVYGMPREAVRFGGVCEVRALPDIARAALDALSSRAQGPGGGRS
jgi:two-component system chemotaxis response regulator CheB